MRQARLDTPKLGMTIWLALAMDGREWQGKEQVAMTGSG